tara:strand:- start:79 stop:1215 length:1137 start_codon:yes stop_codon:yes gene_type:complete
MSTLKVAAIQGVSASSDAITLANDGTCTANITNNLSNRNLIINGAMQVAQRGTSSTSVGFQTVDRFNVGNSGSDETPTQAQVNVDAGTTPYTLGFRKAFKLTNGNQTSGAGAGDFVFIKYTVEAQDIATSGWNFKSASSDITLSFWAKSSVAQNFFGYIEVPDSPAQVFPFQTGSLSADTWTKITVTIPGNSNIVVNNDNGEGFKIFISQFWGTNFTDSGRALNTWAAYNSGQRMPDFTSTWYTTNDATFQITGVQLEVGSVATDFEHRSFAQELQLCRRYFQIIGSNVGEGQNSSNIQGTIQAIPFMRANPSMAIIDNSNNVGLAGTGSNSVTSIGTIYVEGESLGMGGWVEMGGSGFTANRQYHIYGGKFSFSAEL